MKYLISIFALLALVQIGWCCFGDPEGQTGGDTTVDPWLTTTESGTTGAGEETTTEDCDGGGDGDGADGDDAGQICTEGSVQEQIDCLNAVLEENQPWIDAMARADARDEWIARLLRRAQLKMSQ